MVFDMVTVKRALISCADKTGLDRFASTLAGLGVELVASSGTAAFLKTHGLSVKTVEEFVGMTEQLDGRVKTLHPKLHAGILARRDNAAHLESVGTGGLIDLVIVNVYPFQRTVQQSGVSLEEAIEQIDIGGVALLRAAAKNFNHVAVVCQPQQYHDVAEALIKGQGQLPQTMTRQLAVSAFSLTSDYDTSITRYLASIDRSLPAGERSQTERDQRELPEFASVSVRKRQLLRYGENPHQHAAWYVPAAEAAWGLGTLNQLQGKELSYNNLLDIDAALRCLLELAEPACVVVKHHSLCGLAGAATAFAAYERAYACDAESAFGGIVGANRPIDAALAERLTSTFLEVIVAPSVESDAAERFKKKPNLRVVTLDWPTGHDVGDAWRQLSGSWLLQRSDTVTLKNESLRVVTQRAPTERERADLVFAWHATKHAQSNSIILVQERSTVGIGQGQPSRVGSVRLAIQKAGARSTRAVAASDGFFPFPDSVQLLAEAGITAMIQPGGSIRDAEVIAAADQAGIAMLVTGVRHFRH